MLKIARWMAVLAAVLMGGAAQAALLGRDLNGNPVAASDASSVFLYDTDFNITWLQDANANGPMTWNAANTWANNLVVGSYSGWRLPTTLQPDASCSSQYDVGEPFGLQGAGYSCTGSEMGHLWYTELGNTYVTTNTGGQATAKTGAFQNLQYTYWSGTAYAPDPSNRAWLFSTSSGGFQAIDGQGYALYALAVRHGDVVAGVPEPQPYALLLAGLGVLVVVVRRRPISAS